MMRSRLSILPLDTHLLTAFPEWIVEHCAPGARVLEVGAGEGKYGYPEMIRNRVGRLVGVDPDGAIAGNPYLDESYQEPLETFAREQRDEAFDCIYSLFVLEHVTRPDEFVAACRSLLKPGGTLFAATPNLWHYFGLTTKLSSKLGIEDWVLERLRGAEMKESYHFPTAYRLNSVRAVERAVQSAGFRDLEFRLFEEVSRFSVYLPERLRWFPRLYARSMYGLRFPRAMGMLMFKATV